MASFVTIRSQLISLENKSESLLSRYSQFAQTTSAEASTQERTTDTRLEECLTQRQDCINNLDQICNENSKISASKLSQLQRHKEILQEHWQNFRNLRSSIQQERNRLNLLFSVKQDLAQQSVQDEDAYIQEESRRIQDSHNVVDSLLTQAWETRDQFAAQRTVLQGAGDRILRTLQRVPGINNVIAKINTRRKKNALILSTLITVCILLLFFTW
ncbi:LAMI_0F04808g1_1 [Lachancea mirantina]|uniref:Golgi SNAP receptor complex member 1 n=1 Tax=Lachancea mirantina TaxID=1230905 RepID=A0A1G4JY21_9SACH|nr:LAMI_0F04808g1_1 [Lachancea mirantina]